MGDAMIPANMSVFPIAATSATSSSQPPRLNRCQRADDELRHFNADLRLSSSYMKVNIIVIERRYGATICDFTA